MFKFKKLVGALAVTIALVQGFSAIPVKAEEGDAGNVETCWHEECGKYNENAAGSLCSSCNTSYSYVSNNDGISHTHTETCNGCDYNYVNSRSLCFFSNNDNKCTMCGQEKNTRNVHMKTVQKH